MLLEFLARYYKVFWLAFIGIALFKIILSYSFNENLKGLIGSLYSIFKWYNHEEQEMEDQESRRIIMRFHNVVTLFMYLFAVLLAIITIIFKILPK